jgi:hypothetical protein
VTARGRRSAAAVCRAHAGVIVPAAVVAAAFAVVGTVWVQTGIWSFAQQTDSARAHGFDHPAVLFWASDGLMVAGALVALAAALDNRSAPGARLAVALGISLSAWFNAAGTLTRLGGLAHTPTDALGMAVGVPLVSFVALELLLRAVRGIVRRWRGLPAPVAVPGLRLGRLLLGGAGEFRDWRTMYLTATRPDAVPAAVGAQIRDALLAELDQFATAVRDDLARRDTDVADRLAELRDADPAEPIPAGVTAAELAAALERFRATLPRPTVDLVPVYRDLDRRIATAVEAAVGRAVPTGTATARPTGGHRTGPTGATTGGATGSKRDRAVVAYRSLVAAGTDPATITGTMLARAVEGPNGKDSTGYYRGVVRDERAAGTERPAAEVVRLRGTGGA